MAEAIVLSLAGKVANSIASPAFKAAYEKACSIYGARNELEEITNTIKVIQTMLRDAERQQETSERVKLWVERNKDVMYEAEDLFDEVATYELLKKQMEGIWRKYLKEVQVFFSKQNQVVANYSIVKKVESIRKKLVKISADMELFKFVPSVEDTIHDSTRRGRDDNDRGSFVNPKEVFGRDDDKEAILEFLCDKEYADKDISLISIVGIGGMGKTSLAQLVYNDRNFSNGFNEDRRWWACISNIEDEKEVIEKILHSMTGRDVRGLSFDRLQKEIRDCVVNQDKFFLVLDDLWEEKSERGHNLLSLLRSDSAKGSKIIITARSLSVATAMKADKTHELKGLSNDASWELFKMFAFSTKQQESDPNWEILGREIIKKCVNVPLAIRSIANILHSKTTIREWESFEKEELSKIEESDGSISIMSALKLSYDYLPSNLKHCFAYCSLFEKDSVLYKNNLINLWIAQGYVNPTIGSLEDAGHAYFMELFRRCFFCEVKVDANGEIESCKMHDLVHDLAQKVATTEILVLTDSLTPVPKKTRHVSVGCKIDESWSIPQTLLEADRIRSILFLPRHFQGQLILLDKQVAKFRFLRALNLEGLNIKVVPTSIGKLKYMRYLNLSRNKGFETLPNSITKLVNLQTLDISGCSSLRVLPNDFRKLMSLRHLDINGCESLMQMPSRFGELTSLQHLSDFKLSEGGTDDVVKETSGLDSLVALNLQGQLRISYDQKCNWSEDEMAIKQGQIPETIDAISIHDYPNVEITMWWKEDSTPLRLKLTSIKLERCKRVKHLPSFRRLPYLRDLVLDELEELKYIDDDEVVANAPLFFPSLVFLELTDLPKLEGWSPRQNANEEQPILSFHKLSRLCIHSCYRLKSLPSSPNLHQLSMMDPTEEMVQQLVSTDTSSSSLQRITIQSCSGLKSFPGEGLSSIRRLELRGWPALENVRFPTNASVEDLTILRCRKLKLWDHGEEKTGVDWGCLASLRVLGLDQVPESEELPSCLGKRVEQGLLQIKKKK